MSATRYFFDPDLAADSWREVAACRSTTDVDFFPTPRQQRAVRKAKQMCSGCPVSDDCLQFAFETNQQDGIWGGVTPEERRTLRRAWLEERRRAS